MKRLAKGFLVLGQASVVFLVVLLALFLFTFPIHLMITWSSLWPGLLYIPLLFPIAYFLGED